MGWIDSLSRRMGEKSAKTQMMDIDEAKIPGISQDLDILEELRQELIKKDCELEKSRLIWDRTFDSVEDNIVLIDVDRRIKKGNDAFYHSVEMEVGHVEFIGMLWKEFKDISEIPNDICIVDKCFDTGVRQEAIINMHGRMFQVTVHPIYTVIDDKKDLVGVVRSSRDITIAELEKVKLARRSNIYHAISEVTKTLMNHSNWDDAMSLVMGDMGRAIGASRVYIFKNKVKDGYICSMRQHVYTNISVSQCASGLVECVNYDLIPEWSSRMAHGLSATGDIIECHLCDKQYECTCKGDVSVCAVPIFVDKKWWGFIGFDYTNGTRIWKDEDETLLRIAADILGGVIYHRDRYWNIVDAVVDCEDTLEVIDERKVKRS